MDSDDDDAVSPSQPTGQGTKLSADEFKRKVASMCRYMLFVDNKKIPMKRQDITKNVLKEHFKSFPQIFDEAKRHLANIFGFSVVEIKTGVAKTPSYILVNKLDNHADDGNDDAPVCAAQLAHCGLLTTILSLIFMSGGMVTEETLWHTLRQLDLEKGKTCYLGEDPEKLIANEFVRKHYLEKKKVAGPDGPSFEFHWGPRSEMEISMRSILTFVSKIYGVDITSWKGQYKEVLASEQEEETAA